MLILFIKSILLKSYRNYEALDIRLSKGINILYGQNAQGKTNIVESIYLLSTGKSHRTQKDSELVKWNSEDARIRILYEKEKEEQSIEMYLHRNMKKQIKLNGVKLTKIGELIGNLHTVIFSPDHMKIIKEGPAERRRFVDIILSQAKPGYYYNLVQYLKVLEQRNNLLVEGRKNEKLLKTIDVWDEQMASFGSKIIKTRAHFIRQINDYAREIHSKITNEREILDIKYKSSVNYCEETEEGIKKSFIDSLFSFRDIDAGRGLTHKGPHRDDLLFFIDQKESRTYSSQGQQRTSLLSLKLAELEYITHESSEVPVLLLDDVFSELDAQRQQFLIDSIKNIQTIVTCTDVDHLNKFEKKDLAVFHVAEGKIEKEAFSFFDKGL